MRVTSSRSWSTVRSRCEQIAFADVILLNKIDLVDAAALARIERRVRGISATAAVIHSRNADVPLERVLSLGAFDLERALALRRRISRAGATVRVGRAVLAGCGQARAAAHRQAMPMTMTMTTTMTTTTGMDTIIGQLTATATRWRRSTWLLLPAAGCERGVDRRPARSARPRCSRACRVPAAPGAALAAGQRYRLQLQPRRAVPARARRGRSLGAVHRACARSNSACSCRRATPLQQREFGSHHHDLAIGSIGLTDARRAGSEQGQRLAVVPAAEPRRRTSCA